MNSIPLPVMFSSLLLPLVGALLYLVVCTGAIAPIACATIKMALVLVPLVATWRWGKKSWNRTNVRRWMPIIYEGTMAGILMAAGLLWLLLGPGLAAVHASVPRVMHTAQEFGFVEFHHFIVLAVVISVLHSGFEEYYWRWFMFGQLKRRLSTRIAHALAGAGFGAFHLVICCVYAGPLVGVISAAVVGGAGVIWSLMYHRHGSILGCWICHGLCHAALFYVEWLMISGRV